MRDHVSFSRALPVLNFAPFRKYPTKLAAQAFTDDRSVCHNCLSGACCTSEDPIYLTSFDIFRLAAFFDLSPAEFLLKFTQDRFDGEDSNLVRRPWLDDPDSSKVTYLRRRGNTPTSACIFLKYIREPDGTPRRICSVHDARPLSCREYYFNHCKQRVTGELAALLAEGFEQVRDGEITEEMVDAALAHFGAHDAVTARASVSMTYNFWLEMKRVINMEQANSEGAQSYDMAAYQDPIDEKLNRVLSAKYLRFEEDYGPAPRAEQLMPYTAGLSFAGSPEHERIMAVQRNRPASGLFASGNYPHYFGLRTMLPGMKHAQVFPTIPDADVVACLNSMPPTRLFPRHDLSEVRSITQRDVYAAVLQGGNHLIRFSSYLAEMGHVLEGEPRGLIEIELLEMIAGCETSLNSYITHNPYFQPVKQYLAEAAIGLLEELLELVVQPADIFDLYKRLYRIAAVVPALPQVLRRRFETLAHAAQSRLQKDRLELYVRPDNPVEARRAAGKRLNTKRAWTEWASQVRDMRYAAVAGFESVNLPAFYRRSLAELEQLAFRRSHAIALTRVVMNLARSMSFDNRIACAETPYKDTAEQFAAYGAHLFNWLDSTWGLESLDLKLLSEFAAYVYMGLGAGYNCEHNLGRIVHRLLISHLPDGSWHTDPLPKDAAETQAEYLRLLYRTTGACIDGLRMLRPDTLSFETNLGFV